MKQLSPKFDITHFIWETKGKEWYDWIGLRSNKNQCVVVLNTRQSMWILVSTSGTEL